MGLKVAVVGCGRFGSQFVGQHACHPAVETIYLADTCRERALKVAKKWNIPEENVYTDLDDVLKLDIDAVSIYTQRHLHAPMVIKSLKAGKHVNCAVPMATSVEDVEEILRLVKETGLIYMTNEPSVYSAAALYCRARYQAGDFGRFTYGECSYDHDMSHFIDPFTYSGGKNWKQVAGFPPMYYSTHTVARIISVTGSHVEKVSCHGILDYDQDEIFRKGNNLWNNPFANESALMSTADGGVIRINEFRRVVKTANMHTLHIQGDNGTFIDAGNALFATRCGEAGEQTKEVDVTTLLTCGAFDGPIDMDVPKELRDGFFSGESPLQNTKRLPDSYKKIRNGHKGGHHFLVDDFIQCVVQNKHPAYKSAWDAAKYCLPGIIAHESAKQGGVTLDVPYYGETPVEYEILDLDKDAFNDKIWDDSLPTTIRDK